MKRKTENAAKVKRASRKLFLEWCDAQEAAITSNVDWSVFKALVDFADADGACFPSVPTIAAKCRLTDRSVQRGLNSLVQLGIIRRGVRRAKTGRQQSNYIAFNYNRMGDCQSPSPRHTVTPITLNSSTSEVKNSIRGKVALSDSGRGGYRGGPADGVWGDEIPHQTWDEHLACVGGVQ